MRAGGPMYDSALHILGRKQEWSIEFDKAMQWDFSTIYLQQKTQGETIQEKHFDCWKIVVNINIKVANTALYVSQLALKPSIAHCRENLL